MNGNNLNPHAPETRKSIFEEFKRSEDFQRLYREFRVYCLMPIDDSEMVYVKSIFAGGVFQLIAFSLISRNLPVGEVLLSPESTRIFFKELYGAETIEHIFGTSSLDIGEPDGMIISTADGIERVVAICEYTLTSKPRYFKDKYDLFVLRKEQKPEYFSEAELRFITPDDLHFTHHQFRNFTNGIYEHFRLDESATTLKEIQDNARLHYERFRAFQKAGRKLTPELRGFMKRVDAMQPKS